MNITSFLTHSIKVFVRYLPKVTWISFLLDMPWTGWWQIYRPCQHFIYINWVAFKSHVTDHQYIFQCHWDVYSLMYISFYLAIFKSKRSKPCIFVTRMCLAHFVSTVSSPWSKIIVPLDNSGTTTNKRILIIPPRSLCVYRFSLQS